MNNELKIVHFSEEFSIREITDYLKDKHNILYYTRTKNEGKEFHVIKNKNNAFFKLTILQTELLKRYEKVENFTNLIKDIKIKGNDQFVILENINPIIINVIKNDLNKLLLK